MKTNERRDFIKTALLDTGLCLFGGGLGNVFDPTPVRALFLRARA